MSPTATTLRLDDEEYATVKYAAKKSRKTMNAFVSEAALKAANAIVGDTVFLNGKLYEWCEEAVGDQGEFLSAALMLGNKKKAIESVVVNFQDCIYKGRVSDLADERLDDMRREFPDMFAVYPGLVQKAKKVWPDIMLNDDDDYAAVALAIMYQA